MSESLSLYRTILRIIGSSKVHFHDMRCMFTFSWAVVSVLLEKSVHLSKWSVQRTGSAKAASKQRQFARWLKNNRIIPSEIYQPLAQIAFADWKDHKIYLALDGISLWDEFVIVQL